MTTAPMPTSEARILANQANSKLSTGPKTPEGKEKSRANALKHGMTGAGVVLPNEDRDEVERKLAEGGFSVVYQARDSIEGIRVALKIPHAHLLTGSAMEDFRKEVRMVARLEHPHILPLKNAQFIDELFVIVSASGSMIERSSYDM